MTISSITDDNSTRKKKAKPEEWKKNIRKQRRLQGLSYENSRGQTIPEIMFENKDCNCRMKCFNKFTSSQRKESYNVYRQCESHTFQAVYLKSLIKTKNIQRHRPTDNSRGMKTKTAEYSLVKEQANIPVCKTFFRDTFKLSNSTITRLINNNVNDLQDKRGKHEPWNKIDKSFIIAHIESFPAYTSHYTRSASPNKRYLNGDLDVPKMYQEYVKQCQKDQRTPESQSYYSHIFHSEFNLSFKPPAKDTCSRCDDFEQRLKILQSDIEILRKEGKDTTEKEEEKEGIEMIKDQHLFMTEEARRHQKTDTSNASDELFVFTFDFQKALAFPKLTTSICYYKRNLYVYNFGCYDCRSQEAKMFAWCETEGSKGAQEVSSCLIKYIEEFARDHRKIVSFCDCCGGQNRNIKTVLALMNLLQSGRIAAETIELKFLVSGHSYLPNDRNFADIEKAAKKVNQIESAADWISLIRNCKKNNPFNVEELTHKDFHSTAPYEQLITNRKKDTNKEPVNWLKIQWIKLDKGRPFSMFFKTCYDDSSFREVDFSKKNKRWKDAEKIPLYESTRPVTKEKFKDMMDLKKYITSSKRSFFETLCVKNDELEKKDKKFKKQKKEEEEDEEDIVYE